MSQSDPLDRKVITARFYVASITTTATGYATVVFQPAYRAGQNAEWAKATPSGRIELSIDQSLPAFTEWQRALIVGDDIAIEFEAIPKP